MDIRWNLSGAEIERESFRTIESECDLREKLPEPEWRVARRLIHTTADMHIADTLTFRNDAIASGLAALRAAFQGPAPLKRISLKRFVLAR